MIIVARNICDTFENSAPILTEITLQICNVCPTVSFACSVPTLSNTYFFFLKTVTVMFRFIGVHYSRNRASRKHGASSWGDPKTPICIQSQNAPRLCRVELCASEHSFSWLHASASGSSASASHRGCHSCYHGAGAVCCYTSLYYDARTGNIVFLIQFRSTCRSSLRSTFRRHKVFHLFILRYSFGNVLPGWMRNLVYNGGHGSCVCVQGLLHGNPVPGRRVRRSTYRNKRGERTARPEKYHTVRLCG